MLLLSPPPFGRSHRLGLPMVVCVECLPADKPQAVGCGVCDTPELWCGAAGLCARVRACAGAAESLHTYTHTHYRIKPNPLLAQIKRTLEKGFFFAGCRRQASHTTTQHSQDYAILCRQRPPAPSDPPSGITPTASSIAPSSIPPLPPPLPLRYYFCYCPLHYPLRYHHR